MVEFNSIVKVACFTNAFLYYYCNKWSLYTNISLYKTRVIHVNVHDIIFYEIY